MSFPHLSVQAGASPYLSGAHPRPVRRETCAAALALQVVYLGPEPLGDQPVALDGGLLVVQSHHWCCVPEAGLGKPVKLVYTLTHARRIDHYAIGRELCFDPQHVRSSLEGAHYEVQAGAETNGQVSEVTVPRSRARGPRRHGVDRAAS